MNYAYIKALHLVGVVSWFAGLLYIVRLFVYHVEAAQKNQIVIVEQFRIMERRLWYGITSPAMHITLFAGLWMMWQIRAWELPWFHAKIFWLLCLFVYHFYVGRWRKALATKGPQKSSKFFRLQNEVATVLLLAIVFTAVTKEAIAALYALWGFLVLAIAILGGMRAYSRSKAAK
jgi:protoporphyrinogen IX oxidase